MMRTCELSVTQKISEGDRYSVGFTRLDEPVPGVGQESDAVASSDTGTFSLVSLFKRLLTKLPPLVNNTIPVSIKGADVIVNAEISNQVEIKNDTGNPVPVAPAVQQGGGVITATTQRVTLATDGPGVAALNSLDVKTPALSNGRQPVEASVPARTPTTTSVASSTSSVLLLAANPNRRAFTIYNESTAVLRISDSNPATNGNHFATLQPGGFYAEDLQGFTTGAIYGIWTAANGSAQLRELV